jgi:hypothetical protein
MLIKVFLIFRESESVGDGKFRRVILRKKFVFSQTSGLSSVMKRKFRDDFELKFMMSDEKDFDYFIDLLNVREQYDYLVSLVEKQGETEIIHTYQKYVVDVCYYLSHLLFVEVLFVHCEMTNSSNTTVNMSR